MWRLKLGNGENKDYLFSTNNFTERQTWEFDPHAGTCEERAPNKFQSYCLSMKGYGR